MEVRASMLLLRCNPSIPFCTYHLFFLVGEKYTSLASSYDKNYYNFACLIYIYSFISVSSISHSQGYDACISPLDYLFKTTNMLVNALVMCTLVQFLFLADSRSVNFQRWFILRFFRQTMIYLQSFLAAFTRSRLAVLSSVRMKMVSLNHGTSNMPQLLSLNS